MDYPATGPRTNTPVPTDRNLIGVIDESRVQPQKKAEIENPCKQWTSWLIF